MSVRSRHSRRVRTQRSAYAFARGACGAVRTIRMPSAVNRVERAGELCVPVPDQELELVEPVAEIHDQVACLLGHPLPGRVRGGCTVPNLATGL